ncbi:hypothetical protein [Sphingomonas turrisvirgatae]|uniref:Uncharacterized protein n=1 Tax=Sphingomonas turrisvirgatae TaxID=1888892 RepID=A0A1E3M0V3_9SPHN|nr:hypothetical protein [Sphingomonas turrisvirgatae]ODP38660.1 hypothetical protein BFL28_01095 [Sphingomonas turrisvirgatae]
MLNLISLIVGVVTLPIMLVGLVPLLGWINYLVIPMAIVGLVLGVLSSSNTGRNLNIVVLIIGAVRLSLGGFIF